MAVLHTAIITGGMVSRNGVGFLAPLLRNNSRLADLGIKLSIHPVHKSPEKIEGDCVIVESQCIQSLYKNNYKLLVDILLKLKKNSGQLIFFDLNDDSASGYFDLLPYFDLYCKSYVLHDKSLYKKDLYGGRIWTDFYHTHYGVNDVSKYENRPITSDHELQKIRVGYLLGLVDYSEGSIFTKGKVLRESLRKTGLINMFLKGPFDKDFVKPSINRKNALSCRINTNYARQRNSIVFHRQQIVELLGDRIPLNKIGKKEYIKELRHSKIVISPFGWGEINVARDYEVAMNGSILMKPEIGHMDTYPDIFNKDTTLQFKWDFSDLESKIEYALDNYNDYISYADNLQQTYRYYMCSEEGRNEFSEHFLRILKGSVRDSV